MDKKTLNQLALGWGADFFGVADLTPFKEGGAAFPPEILGPYTRGISMGVALSRGVFDGIIDGPTPHYTHHYTKVNELLDHVALRLSGAIQSRGHRSLPIPASQILEWDRWLGAVSHKAVARMAGLGWQGKSLLLVNPLVGPRIRVVTVLTDLDLVSDQPLDNRCGECRECEKACPAGAIKGTSFGDHGYRTRGEAWDEKACTGIMVKDFNNRPGVTPWVCGLCIKACPFGKALKPY